MSNELFRAELEKQYTWLFATDPEYAYWAAHTTPPELALKVVRGLNNGTFNKDGKGIKRACKALGIKHTYVAIHAFLQEK